jgi:hypothetical protein
MGIIWHDTKPEPWQASARLRAPMISVIATVTSAIVPAAWLSELARRCAQLGAELIVVAGTVPNSDPPLNDQAGIRIILAEAESSRLELRAQGIQAATGDIVLFVDERGLIDPAALEMLVRAGLGRGGVHRHRVFGSELIPSDVSGTSAASTRPALGGRPHHGRREDLRESAI